MNKKIRQTAGGAHVIPPFCAGARFAETEGEKHAYTRKTVRIGSKTVARVQCIQNISNKS